MTKFKMNYRIHDHHRPELDHLRTGVGGASAHPEREPTGDPGRLGQQARLAHARRSLDEHNRARARTDPVQRNPD